MSGPRRIQRKRTRGWRMPAGAVYVGRPSRWANPFRVGGPIPEPWSLTAKYAGRVVEDRQMAVELFKSYAHITPGYADLVRREDVPAELVERTAAAICNNDGRTTWDRVRHATADRYRNLARHALAAVLPEHEHQVRERVAAESGVLAPADLAEILDYVAGRGDVRVVRNETLDRAFAALKATLPAALNQPEEIR